MTLPWGRRYLMCPPEHFGVLYEINPWMHRESAVDPRCYHLDLTFCPLDERRAITAPGSWDDYGRRVVEAVVPERLELEPDEALTFCANSVVVGDTVVMPACPPRVGRQLDAWGF